MSHAPDPGPANLTTPAQNAMKQTSKTSAERGEAN